MNFPFSIAELGKNFLKNDILSIDIGFTNIKIVHARKKAGNVLKIVNYGIGNTPEGCIKNGVISNLDGIMENLKKVIEENGMNERNVKLLISAGSNIVSKIIYVIKADGRKVEERIREEISKQMPVDMRFQKLFYRITGYVERRGIEYCRVLVTIVPNTIIDNYIKLIKLLNFKPVAIEIPFSSVARFFSKGVKVDGTDSWNHKSMASEFDMGSTAVVDLGSETTNLSILYRGSLEFNRIILTGGRVLDEIIAAKLGVDRELAEKYKKNYGITDSKQYNDDIVRVVDSCLRDYLGEILSNINRSMEFYAERCGGQPVKRIFFIGGGSGLNGLKDYARNVTGKPVYTVSDMEFGNVEFEDVLDRDKLRFFINAVGLAM